jgi:biotin carboxylase
VHAYCLSQHTVLLPARLSDGSMCGGVTLVLVLLIVAHCAPASTPLGLLLPALTVADLPTGIPSRTIPGTGPSAYLNIAELVAIAVQTKCVAVAPGYGFLSESAPFSASVAAANLLFVGPSPAALQLFGDKVGARAFAQANGVAVIPGMAVASSIELAKFIRSVNVNRNRKSAASGRGGDSNPNPNSNPPNANSRVSGVGSAESSPTTLAGTASVMLKASHGGGGRGMRVVRSEHDAAAAFDRCASEAMNGFGASPPDPPARPTSLSNLKRQGN